MTIQNGVWCLVHESEWCCEKIVPGNAEKFQGHQENFTGGIEHDNLYSGVLGWILCLYRIGNFGNRGIYMVCVQEKEKMKQPKRLTREQKEAVAASRLNPNNWMLAGETEFYLKVIHKESGIIRSVDKFRRLERRRIR
nr:MAG TPA: S64, SPIDER VENOM PEPTIDE, ICK [Bacteriophage sp.]